MQRKETISLECVEKIVDAIFVGEPEIYEADSTPDVRQRVKSLVFSLSLIIKLI